MISLSSFFIFICLYIRTFKNLNNQYLFLNCWYLIDLEKLKNNGELEDNGGAEGDFAECYLLEDKNIEDRCGASGIEFRPGKFPF